MKKFLIILMVCLLPFAVDGQVKSKNHSKGSKAKQERTVKKQKTQEKSDVFKVTELQVIEDDKVKKEDEIKTQDELKYPETAFGQKDNEKGTEDRYVTRTLKEEDVTYKSFDCELLSFEYPSSFRNVPIQQAPHMVLKLESKDYFFSISYWDNEYPDEMTAWDNLIYSLAQNYKIDNGVLVSITKDKLVTKGGDVKCLKLKFNIQERVQGYDFKMKNLMYIVVNQGYLFMFSFMSEGQYAQSDPTTYYDNIMKGLKLKHITHTENKKDDFHDTLLKYVKTLNAQCPIESDECTVFENVILVGNSITIKTVIPDECEPFIDLELFKYTMCSNFSKALDQQFFEYLKKEKYNVVYMIYNEYNEYKNRVTISAQDVLYYYK